RRPPLPRSAADLTDASPPRRWPARRIQRNEGGAILVVVGDLALREVVSSFRAMVQRQPIANPESRVFVRWARWLSVAMGLLTALVLMFGAPRAALAEHGRLVRWDLGDASEQLAVGRAMLRYEPGLDDAALELAEQLPGWWEEIELALGR